MSQPAIEDGLDDRERRILEFESGWSTYAGAKARAIRDEFGLSTTRYYQLLNALIDTQAALRFDPMLVKRLQRIRAGRQQNQASADERGRDAE